jgi:small-conductance mechanosensitive channel/ABC-type branched-subunit amino acid transport system substrate-binding protein
MTTLATRISSRLRQLPKGRRFAVFLAMAAVAGAIVSAIAYVTIFREPLGRPVAIALVAPMTGPEAARGAAVRDGAAQWVAQQARTPQKRPIELRIIDSHAEPEALRRAAADPDVVAILSGTGPRPAEEAAAASLGVPRIALAGDGVTAEPWSFPLSATPAEEARFLANYLRNVLGERLVSIILPQTEEAAAVAEAFDTTLQRFGTRVVYRWAVPAEGPGRGAGLRAAAEEISTRQIAGTILVLGDPGFAAETVATLGGAEVANRIAGLRDLGTNAFLERLRAAWRGPGSIGAALNGALVTTPVLFDMAGVEAQAFQAAFRAQRGGSPDFLAVLGHDAARAIGQAVARLEAPGTADGQSLRRQLRATLAAARGPEAGLTGLGGAIFFEERGSPLPVLVGAFDGDALIAARTQLSPIRDEGVSNYIEQLQAGRVLYVNDRFMYRTNVVSAGIRLNKINALDLDANTAELDFMLWFRWRGAATAPDIVFENAVTPVVLGEPERATDDGEERYRAWRVRGKFFLNFSAAPRAYGAHGVGVAFRHRTLARNNLMFVADVVGMDLSGAGRAAEPAPDLLAQLLGAPAGGGSRLVRQLEEARVLAGVRGFVVDEAFLSQELARSGTDGDPSYVGFGRPSPLFSRVTLDVVVKRDAIDLRALLPRQALAYLVIFALSGTILAYLLDRRDRGQFWRMQTLVLRIATWPVLLGAGSALALDYAVANAGLAVVSTIDLATRALWWLVPARLATLTVARFVWAPLEARTQRRVPTVFRFVVSGMVYAMAGFGIVSFVLERPVTNLLATSGLLTLIVGLALQSNLRDIFSGIILNLERPFVLGDWVRINNVLGQVHDISWRTTRLLNDKDQVIAFANGKVVDAEIQNLTRAGFYDATVLVYMDPRCVPEEVIPALTRAAESVTDIPFRIARVVLFNVENIGGSWAARYVVDLRLDDMNYYVKLRAAVWPAIWRELRAAGLAAGLIPRQVEDMPPGQARLAAVSSSG